MVDSMTVGADSDEPQFPLMCVLCPFCTDESFLSTPLRCMLAVKVAFLAESTAQRTFTMEQNGECVQATWMGMHRCFLNSLQLGIF